MPRAFLSRRRAALLLLVPLIPMADPGDGEAQRASRPRAAGPARPAESARGWRLTYNVEQTGTYTVSATATGPSGPVTVTGTSSYRFTCNGSALLAPDGPGVFSGPVAIRCNYTTEGSFSSPSSRATMTGSGIPDTTNRSAGLGLDPDDRQYQIAFRIPAWTEVRTISGEYCTPPEIITPTSKCVWTPFTEVDSVWHNGDYPSFEQPLPPGATTLSGTNTDPPDSEVSGTRRVTWKLSGGPRTLVANAGGPYRVDRAGTVTLDGSRSKGDITSYTWTFAPVGRGLPLADVTKSGVTVPVQVLETIDATLTVSDGSDEDRQTVRVTVVPRTGKPWETTFAHVPDEGQITDNTPTVKTIRESDGSQSFVGQLKAGENVAADDNSAGGDHIFSPKATNGSWAGTGYGVAQVTDGGPFQGYWYVDGYTLGVRRRTLINKYLLPDGPSFSGFKGKPLYQGNKDLGLDIDGYLAAVRAHEGLQGAKGVLGHSGLMRKALVAADPAVAVERQVGTDSAAVVTKADDAIWKAEITLCEKSADPLPQTWTGKLAFPRDDYTGYEVATVVVGGTNEVYRSMASCKASRSGAP